MRHAHAAGMPPTMPHPLPTHTRRPSPLDAALATNPPPLQAWEASSEACLLPDRPWVMRLDGVAFRRYTAGLSKPFDAR